MDKVLPLAAIPCPHPGRLPRDCDGEGSGKYAKISQQRQSIRANVTRCWFLQSTGVNSGCVTNDVPGMHDMTSIYHGT